MSASTCTADGRSSTGWTRPENRLDSVRVDNVPSHFAKTVSVAPVGSDVIVEATYGWYWAADLLKDMGYEVHLANPHGNDWGHRRVKNDERDARDLADLLRLGRLAEAWIAPPKTRELREMIRFRVKLTQVRTGLKAQVHAVMAKNWILPSRGDMWGPGGNAQLDSLEIPDPTSTASPCSETSLTPSTARSSSWTATSTASSLMTPATTPSRPSMASDPSSPPSSWPKSVTSPVSILPRPFVRGRDSPPSTRSPTPTSTGGRITKQGSRLVRWAAIEAVARYHGGAPFRESFESIAERRGKNRANVAIARKVLTLVYYGLRDGEIRCLADQDAA